MNSQLWLGKRQQPPTGRDRNGAYNVRTSDTKVTEDHRLHRYEILEVLEVANDCSFNHEEPRAG